MNNKQTGSKMQTCDCQNYQGASCAKCFKPGSAGLTLTNRKDAAGNVTVDILCNDATGVGLVGFKPSDILALPDLLRAARLAFAEIYTALDSRGGKLDSVAAEKAANALRIALCRAEGR